MNKAFIYSILFSLPVLSMADNRSRLDIVDSFSDSARLCLSVGLQASLSQLDNFKLNLKSGQHGAAGAIYEGLDQFHLESNGQVSILIDSTPLSNGGALLDANYTINNTAETYTTTGDAYSGNLTINGQTRLKNISAQRAGTYQGSVTLTVTPAMGGLTGCGSQTIHFPEQSMWATLAWEDLYPSSGDADYNDLVVNFRVTEKYDSAQKLESVHMEFIPVGRGAGYNHALMLSLDGIINKSKNITGETLAALTTSNEIEVNYTDFSSGQTHTRYFSDDDDIVIFSNSRAAMGAGYANVYEDQPETYPKWFTTVDISLAGDNGAVSNGLITGDFNYRPYLHVMNTNSDIDIYTINQADGMIDQQGYPFGLMVPTDWSWPNERVAIDNVYPYFEEYRSWLSGQTDEVSDNALYWYDYPAAGSDSFSSNLTLPE